MMGPIVVRFPPEICDLILRSPAIFSLIMECAAASNYFQISLHFRETFRVMECVAASSYFQISLHFHETFRVADFELRSSSI